MGNDLGYCTKVTVNIFVQAAADVAFALSVCDARGPDGDVRLFVVHVESLYRYVKSLDLKNASVFFIPYVLDGIPANPLEVIRRRRLLAAVYRAHFAGRKPSEVIFFCTSFDAVTAYFVTRLSRTSRVSLIDHYHLAEDRLPRWSPRCMALWLLYKAMTGVSFYFCQDDCQGKRCSYTGFEYAKWGIRSVPLEEIGDVTPKCRVPLPAGGNPAVLFMESNYANSAEFEDYQSTIEEVVGVLRAHDYRVYIKPHPRLGYSPFLDRLDVTVLPGDVPAEFFDPRTFCATIALDSYGLVRIAGGSPRVLVSLVDVVRYTDPVRQERMRSNLCLRGAGQIRFPNSIDEVVAILLEGSRAD